jgi:hypothetical protein
MQLAMAHIHPPNTGGAVLQQTISETAGGLPDIKTNQALWAQTCLLQGTFQLQTPARDKPGFGIVKQQQFTPFRQHCTVFVDGRPRLLPHSPAHAGSNQSLRLRARGGQAALDQQLVSAHRA